MKQKLILFAIFCFGLGIQFGFSQQNIKVYYYEGTSDIYTIQEAGKLCFSSENLLINQDGGSVV